MSSYLDMSAMYKRKAKQARTLAEVEYALKDIRETLALHQGERMLDILSGNFRSESAYEQKLLAERDAYIERWQQLRRTS